MASQEFRRRLWYLLLATRGGITRAKILHLLKENPMNVNQLAKLLGLDYTTVRHHINVLKKNGLILATGEKYAAAYFLSSGLESSYQIFLEIWEKIRKR